jgi:VanZ family protein
MPASLSPSQKLFRSVCWLGIVIWLSTVFYLSSRPTEALIEDLPFIMQMWDKGLHFIAFFCGTLPLVPALRLTYGWPWPKVMIVAVASVSLYGALDEVHQYWTPSRTGLSVADWVADTLGAVAGAPVAAFVHAIIERKNRPAPAAN